jgi:hypothetical protein
MSSFYAHKILRLTYFLLNQNPSLYVINNMGNLFYKIQNWFESIWSLFAKFSEEKHKRKRKEKEKEQKGRGEPFSPWPETAHGPANSRPNRYPPPPYLSD